MSVLALSLGMSASAVEIDGGAAMAYGLSASPTSTNVYTLTYGISSSKVTGATITVTDGNSRSVAIPVTPSKGINNFVLNLNDPAYAALEDGDLTWKVEVNSTIEGTEPVNYATQEATGSSGSTSNYKGGVASIVDPTQPSFGYTLVSGGHYQSAAKAPMMLFAPDGTLQSLNYDLTNANSQFAPSVRLDKFVMADYSDKHSGLWIFDPLNPAEPVQMFQGTPDGDGLYVLDETNIGGSVSGACVSADGTQIYVLDEDIVNGKLMRYDVGASNTISAGPNFQSSTVVSSYSGLFKHSNNKMIWTEHGIFISQTRSAQDAMPVVMLWDPATDTYSWKPYTKAADTNAMPVSAAGSSGGIAMNREGTKFALCLSSGSGVDVFSLSWDGDTPNFTARDYTVGTLQSDFNGLAFDYAGNLWVAEGATASANGRVKAWAFPGSHSVTTPANCTITKVDSSSYTKLYCAADWDGDGDWKPATAPEFVFEGASTYSITLPAGATSCKISTVRGDWDAFNAACRCIGGNPVVGNYAFDNYKYTTTSGDANITLDAIAATESWTVYVNLDANLLWAVAPQHLYVAADWSDNGTWDIAEAHEMALNEGIFSITLPARKQSFRISRRVDDWDTFNSYAACVADDETLTDYTKTGNKFDLYKGSNNTNCNLDDVRFGEGENAYAPNDSWTVYVDWANGKIWGELPLHLYLRGASYGWGATQGLELETSDGNVFTAEHLNLSRIAAGDLATNGFKIAEGDWQRHNYGLSTNYVTPNRGTVLEVCDANISPSIDLTDCNLEFVLSSRTLTLTDNRESVRAAYAYAHSYEIVGDKDVTFSFKSTAAAPSAKIVLSLYDAATTYELDFGAVVEGNNSRTLNLPVGIASGLYDWKVVFTLDSSTRYAVVKTISGDVTAVRTGVVCIDNPESEYHGYIINSLSNNGVRIYDPMFNLVETKFAPSTGIFNYNNYAPWRVQYNDGKVYIGACSDSQGGIYVWDIDKDASVPVQMFQGDQYATGIWEYDENEIGGSNIFFCFAGEGASRQLLTIDEDLPAVAGAYNWRPIRKYSIGASDQINMMYENIGNESSTSSTNYSSGLWISKKHDGVWRANYRDGASGVAYAPSFSFEPLDGSAQKMYNSKVAKTHGIIAVNEAEDTMFLLTDSGVQVYNVAWDGDVPSVTLDETIANSKVNSSAYGTLQFNFDLAGNLLLTGNNGQIKVISMKHDGKEVVSAAPKSMAFAVSNEGVATSVQDMLAEEAAAEVVYYNLNGQRVAADNLRSGIYIRVAGTKASKVFVK